MDRLDEVWQGVRHLVPGPSFEHAVISQQLALLLGPPPRAAGLLTTMSGFNLGESEHDFRVPDGGLHRPGAAGVWLCTAALLVEILAPGDESSQKLSFYAAQCAARSAAMGSWQAARSPRRSVGARRRSA